MIVVDASVVVAVLIAAPAGRSVRARLSGHDLAAPDILDLEVASALRGLWLARRLDDRALERAVVRLGRLHVDRHASAALVPRALQLRANLTPYDAGYVALAEVLDCVLITADRRLAKAPGIRCAVEVLEG